MHSPSRSDVEDFLFAEADLLEQWIPDARIEVIEGPGHWPQWEKPNEFHRAHLRFLTGGTED